MDRSDLLEAISARRPEGVSWSSSVSRGRTHFCCIAVLDGNFVARALAGRPCGVLLASFGQPRSACFDNVERHKSFVDWREAGQKIQDHLLNGAQDALVALRWVNSA